MRLIRRCANCDCKVYIITTKELQPFYKKKGTVVICNFCERMLYAESA